jgi:hypothetical protein
MKINGEGVCGVEGTDFSECMVVRWRGEVAVGSVECGDFCVEYVVCLF